MTRAHYLHIGMTAGMGKKEVLLSTPGEVADQWELYLRAHGVKRMENNE